MNLTTLLLLAGLTALGAEPLRLCPENPRYLELRGKPIVLVASGEHYGAVLNLDFDPSPYLDELQRQGLNLTRTFSGTYREVPGSFRIRGNTLAPRAGRFCCPWPERDGKFDLDHFNDAYFRRLKGFVGEAGRRGVVVEYVFFCPLYEDGLWDVSPMNARNNVNGVGKCPRTEALTLRHPALVKRQLAFVKKAVTELNTFDNIYFEICNEPYFGGVTLDWQHAVAETIVSTEKTLPNKHLIAQNIANGKAVVSMPFPEVSIFNFHYATPPDAVAMNEKLRKPIAFDETGFTGTEDRTYRRQAWEFLMAGGAVFSMLDYSFTPEHEDGSAQVDDPTPGGGSRALRRQLGFLRTFVESFDLRTTAPETGFVGKTNPPELRGQLRGLADERDGKYGLYLTVNGPVSLSMKLPAGSYLLEWIDPSETKTLQAEPLKIAGGEVLVKSPKHGGDLVLRISRQRGR
jgi:hypothetical protein